MKNNRLFTARYSNKKYLVCSAFNNSIHGIMANSKNEALKKGRRWFGHVCYIV